MKSCRHKGKRMGKEDGNEPGFFELWVQVFPRGFEFSHVGASFQLALAFDKMESCRHGGKREGLKPQCGHRAMQSSCIVHRRRTRAGSPDTEVSSQGASANVAHHHPSRFRRAAQRTQVSGESARCGAIRMSIRKTEHPAARIGGAHAGRCVSVCSRIVTAAGRQPAAPSRRAAGAPTHTRHCQRIWQDPSRDRDGSARRESSLCPARRPPA